MFCLIFNLLLQKNWADFEHAFGHLLILLLSLTNKEDTTVLCSVVKHAGSGRARKKCRGKHEAQSSVFPHFLSALPLLKKWAPLELTDA